ncbi:hypothetical protein K7X08_005272 [Anisodus acutangulus]|uniref:Uncharacterized protein n=1 Tax=Anisodus acutangulus TaxID=402998 RepID=A0A9Q1R6N8_9SOLA|nr:hypothetical protein K7X08_005272 [Anisodus acutangulus]
MEQSEITKEQQSQLQMLLQQCNLADHSQQNSMGSANFAGPFQEEAYGSCASSKTGLCHRSWIPSLCSLLCSMGIIWAVRYKTDTESHLEKLLEREKEDGKLLAKCVEELKRKGLEFDLLKEVDALRRAKSLRVVEAKDHFVWLKITESFYAQMLEAFCFCNHVVD